MANSEKGPVWGGAAEEWQKKKRERGPERQQKPQDKKRQRRNFVDELEKKLNRKKELEMAKIDKSILFDTDNFRDLNIHLDLLEEARVGSIKIGKEEVPIDMIKRLIDKVIEDFSDENRKKKVREGSITDERILQYLVDSGVVKEKIASDSLQGFSQCLFKCIKNFCAKEV